MNKKILFFFITTLFVFSLEIRAAGFTTSSVGYANNGVGPNNYIVSTINNLILDISLPDPVSDTVLSGSGTPTAGSAIITNNSWSSAAIPVFFHDNGNDTWAVANDGIFTDDDSSGTYTVGDTQLAGTGIPIIGSAIVTANPWSTVFFYDNGNSIWSSADDGIFYDIDGSGYYNGDKVYSVYISNSSTAGPAAENEISAIKIWQENDSASGFQAGSDNLIGSQTSSPYWDQTILCSSAIAYASSSKDRIYVTVDISPKAVNRRTIKGSIPANNLTFVSNSDGPTDTNIVNNNAQTVLTGSTIDQEKPTSSIDNVSTSTVIALSQPFTITGVSADTGGSSVQKVEISFDNGITWLETTPLIAQNNGFTWKYIWTNPVTATYTLKVKATDWIGNVEVPTTGITITVGTPIQENTATSTSATTTIETSTTTTQDQLIMTLQLKLIELLKQLIELLKARL